MTTAREMQAALRQTHIMRRREWARSNPNEGCGQCLSASKPVARCTAPSHWSAAHLVKAYTDLVRDAAPYVPPVPPVEPARDEPAAPDTVEPAPAAISADPITNALGALIGEVLKGQLVNIEKRLASVESREQTYKGIEIRAPNGATRKVDGLFHPKFADVLLTAQACGIVYLHGPAGTGKTHIGKQLAEVLDRPFYFDSVTAGTSEGNLSGWLLPVEAGGQFVFVSVGFVKAYEEGGVYLADEFDAIDRNVAVFLNAALANGHMSLPKRHENPVAHRHADFVFVAAGNTDLCGANRSYNAREALDLATRDRFAGCMIGIGYDPALEEALAHAYGDTATAVEALAFARSLRTTIEAHQMEKVASYRLITTYAKLRSAGMSRKTVLAQALGDWTRDEIAKLDEAYRP